MVNVLAGSYTQARAPARGTHRLQSIAVVAANSADEFVSLASTSRRSHILEGHRYGGEAGNTWFPRGWSDDKIIHQISDVATDPSLTWVQTSRTCWGLNSPDPVRPSGTPWRAFGTA